MTNSSPINPNEVQYAGFWLRAVAYIIDGLILCIASIPINVVGLYIIGSHAVGTQQQQDAFANQVILIDTAVCLVVSIFYFSIFESLAPQATPGKMIMKLEVTDVDGKRPSFVRAFIRNVAKIPSWLFLNIGFLMAAFTGRKQAFHDMVAGCLVLRLHPSRETKWQAVHHKHKTSWKDPANPEAKSAPKNIAAVQSQEQLGTANGEDRSKINLAEVAAQPIPAGAVRDPAPKTTSAKAPPAPSPVIPAPAPHAQTTALVPQPETTALVHQPETKALVPPADTTAVAPGTNNPVAEPAPQAQAAFLQADLSAFSTQPALPSDLGALPSPVSIAPASHADSAHALCDTCGAVLDDNFSFCIKCMTPKPS
jgi:uncharacterized RDD family membrane protein YckC